MLGKRVGPPCEVVGGEVMLPGVDGGIGHENREGEMTPLLAILTPPIEVRLFRGLGNVGEGDRGYPSDTGETTYSSDGDSGREFPRERLRTGGPSRRCDMGATVRLGCVTGAGSTVPYPRTLCRLLCLFSAKPGSRSSQNKRPAPNEDRFLSLSVYGATLNGVNLIRIV